MTEPRVERIRDLAQGILRAAQELGDEPRAEAGVGYLQGDSNLGEAIEKIAASEKPLTLLAGAGVSMEAGLPSWLKLVRELLTRAGTDLDPAQCQEWIAVLEREGPLAAASVAEAFAKNEADYRRRVRRALYSTGPPRSFSPQALAQQIAWFQSRFPDEVQVVTVNYDGLLEAAMARIGLDHVSYAWSRPQLPSKPCVWHLHGRLIPGSAGGWLKSGRIVLSEADYTHAQYAKWPEAFMREVIQERTCVLVGLSLTDPNLIRWLYRYGRPQAHQHVALFVRQGSPTHDPTVLAKREEGAKALAPLWGSLLFRQLLRRGGPGAARSRAGSRSWELARLLRSRRSASGPHPQPAVCCL